MFIWLVLIVLTVALDQLSKYLVILHLKPVGSVPIIEDVLHLTVGETQIDLPRAKAAAVHAAFDF